MSAAVRVEAMKLRRSLVGVLGSAVLVGGFAAICAGMLAAIRSGDPQLTAKLGDAATFDWAGLLSSAAQVMGAGALLGFGVVLAWLFAREFAEGTITGLFALPVGRGAVAAAKFIVFAGWAIGVSVTSVGSILLVGLAFGLGTPDSDTWAGLARLLLLGVLTAAISTPVAWVATIARSLLAGVTAAIGLVVVAQIGVLAGAGGWMPLAAPTMWALSLGQVVPIQLGFALAMGCAWAGATIWLWHRLQLDR